MHCQTKICIFLLDVVFVVAELVFDIAQQRPIQKACYTPIIYYLTVRRIEDREYYLYRIYTQNINGAIY